MSPELQAHIASRKARTGWVQVWASFMYGADGRSRAVQSPHKIEPLRSVDVPIWLVAGVRIAASCSPVLVLEVSPEMCLVRGSEFDWPIETEMVLDFWRLVA